MNIKEKRKNLGLTQKQLSDLTGIPVRTIQNWEEGKRKPKKYIIELIENKLRKENENGKDNRNNN